MTAKDVFGRCLRVFVDGRELTTAIAVRCTAPDLGLPRIEIECYADQSIFVDGNAAGPYIETCRLPEQPGCRPLACLIFRGTADELDEAAFSLKVRSQPDALNRSHVLLGSNQ